MRRSRTLLAATAILVLSCIAVQAALAAPGALDPTLGRRGMVALPFGDLVGANAAAVQRNGRIVTAAEAELSNGKDALVSTRLLPDGRLDRSYGDGGWVTVNIDGSGGGDAISIQPNGDILIAGGGRAGKRLSFAAVKLEPDGALDTAFGRQGVATVTIGSEAIATSIAVQPDGKILLGGIADKSSDQFAIARLNANGSIDRTFGTGGVTAVGSDAAAWGMALQPDGRILLAGESGPAGGSGILDTLLGTVAKKLESGNVYMAVRLLSNGEPDPSFGHNGIVTVPIGIKALCTAIALQPDGKVIITGNAFTNAVIGATVRLMPNGSLDPTFGIGGVAEQPIANGINAVALQPDGKIVLAATGPTAIRLDPDGSLDDSFGTAGVVRLEQASGNGANGVTIERSNGDIVLSGALTISGRVEEMVARLYGS